MTFPRAPCFISASPPLPSCLRRSFTAISPPTGLPPSRSASPTRHPRRVHMSIYAPPDSVLLPPALLLADISDVNKGSLYATAFVFFLTFWGGISFVKGSTKPRVTQASFTLREPAASLAKQTARYLMQRSFVPDLEKDGRDGVVTFTGAVRASTSVASILVAVAASGIWSASYILNFVLPDSLQSPYWGWLSVLSVLVVPWYWKKAARTEEVKLLVEQEEDGVSKLYVKGHRDEIEEMERAFSWKRDEPVYEGDDNQAPKAAIGEPEKTKAQ